MGARTAALSKFCEYMRRLAGVRGQFVPTVSGLPVLWAGADSAQLARFFSSPKFFVIAFLFEAHYWQPV